MIRIVIGIKWVDFLKSFLESEKIVNASEMCQTIRAILFISVILLRTYPKLIQPNLT